MQPKWIVWENVPGVLSSGKGRDFGTFLGALGELGYGFAYRVLDAQWFGVAQRRRRVFVIGHLGDWRRAAAVLFERESVFGNPPTRGKTREDAAGSTGDGVARCVTTGESRRQDWETCNFVAGTLNANGKAAGSATQQDAEQGLLVATAVDLQNVSLGGDLLGTLDTTRPGRGGGQAVAFTKPKRAQSTTDDETWVPGEVSPTMSCFDQGDTRATTVVAIQERAICENPDAGPDGAGVRADGVSYTLEARTVPQAVAFANRTRDGIKVPEVMKDGVVPALTNPGGGGRSDAVNVATPMAVRRLTPRECERLQGFPDDYTLVEYRKKPAADGPRYRALGNSMAVPVMRWIGERIKMEDELRSSP
jgi:DNA (cytosine-5)-methyltransferase 1